MNIILGKNSKHEEYLEALKKIETLMTRLELNPFIERAYSRMKGIKGKVIVAWSGGKESIVLLDLAKHAVKEAVPVLGRTDLEFPSFDRWLEKNLPPRTAILNNQWDMDWLADHPQMLFPNGGNEVMKWYKGVQHWAQEQYCKSWDISVMLTGRRTIDGNFVGPAGVYSKKGVKIVSPMYDWPNEAVLAYFHYHRWKWPPFYSMPRGFYIGSGPWPARTALTTRADNWKEIKAIDPSIWKQAVDYSLPGAFALKKASHA